ncbi:MAG: hypothetical protein OEZ59_00785, partial [Deltaproteobacteria bacterium]|nr:hypothetical protein [Deltaproteobacteria bacterium]
MDMKNKNNTKKTFSGVWRPGCWLKGAVPALLLMVTLAASPVLASHHEKHLDLQSFMQSDLRALAMGGGFTSVARGESSLLYNPAGLSQYLMGVKVAGQFTLDMEDNYFLTDTVKLMPIPGMDQLMNVFEKLKVVKNRNTTLGLIDYYDEYAGESQHFRWERYYNLVANLGAMGFGFGVGMIKQDRLKLFFNDNGDGTFDILNQTPPDNLYTEHKTVEGMLYGFSLHTKDGQLLLGLGLKDLTYIERTKTEQFTDTMTLSLPKDGYSYETRAFDLGIIWRLAFMGKLRGQWGMTMHNLGGLELDNPNTVQNPVDPPDRLVVPSTYNLGISINPDLGPFKLLMVAELEDFTNNIKVHVSDTQN